MEKEAQEPKVKWRVVIEDVERGEREVLELGRGPGGRLEWRGQVMTSREMGLRIGVLLGNGA